MPVPSGRRFAVIGDVAGHLVDLEAELRRLGADPSTGTLPPDLTVVQVGDLVHRGPASDAVIRLVDAILTSQPDQWIQLVGNHEAQYLRPPAFDWPERLDPASIRILRGWWESGRMRAATSMSTETESFLITHAGLTADFWVDVLGAPPEATTAAAAVDALIGTRDADLFRAGQMLRGRRRERAAGPLWAAAATELLPSWSGRTLPFSQVHGHTSVFDWQHRKFRARTEIVRATTVDEQAKHEVTQLDGGRIIGIDPGHGDRPHHPWRAWEPG